MRLPRSGTWRPGTIPALLIVQLVTCFVAALRGLDYLRPGAAVALGPLAAVESSAPAAVWGGLLLGAAVTVLLGLAARWAPLIAVGHLLLASVYLGCGIPVASAAVRDPAAAVSAAAAATLALYALVHPRAPGGFPARLLGAVTLTGSVVLLSTALGDDFRPAASLLGGAGVHGALALGVGTLTFRASAARSLEQEEVPRC